MAIPQFTGVKVFSTTLARDREVMGENITRWLKENPGVEIVDIDPLSLAEVGAAKLADTPDAFDVVVMPNLFCEDQQGLSGSP